MRRGEGNTVIGADGPGQTAFVEEAFKGGKGELFAVGFQRFAQQQVARGIVGDRQRITIPFIVELELALVIGAPEVVGMQPLGQGRPFSSIASAGHGFDQAMAIQNGMNG